LIYDIQKINFDECVSSDFFEAFGFISYTWTERIPGNGILPTINSFP